MYLVSSHLGGVYLSNLDYGTITETCDTCFDSDSVEFSFDENSAYDAVIEYAESCKKQGEYFWGPAPLYFCSLCLEYGLITQEQHDELVEKLELNREEEEDDEQD